MDNLSVLASGRVQTPAYVLDVARLKRNMATIARIKKETGCRILLATKAFSMPAAFPWMRDVLDGTTASGLYEARLGKEEFGKEVHVYAPAYTEDEIRELAAIAHHVYFNSPEQMKRFLPVLDAAGGAKEIGIRINPEYSKATLGGDLYDPCSPCSRFGTRREHLEELPWERIDILHAHALCEALHDGSAGLVAQVGDMFGDYVRRVKSVNFGGGHFVNKPGYDVTVLINAVKNFQDKFGVQVILEPGAAMVYDAGWLVTTVLDIHRNEKNIAILDTSASTHMPDVLEVPYTPQIIGAAEAGVQAHDYVLGGKTCMTGDIIGEYSFGKPLKSGDRLVFTDMMQYSFVKNTNFNGTPLPDLAILHEDGRYEVVKRFGYADFRSRLG